jgi:hypothetical protein
VCLGEPDVLLGAHPGVLNLLFIIVVSEVVCVVLVTDFDDDNLIR